MSHFGVLHWQQWQPPASSPEKCLLKTQICNSFLLTGVTLFTNETTNSKTRIVCSIKAPPLSERNWKGLAFRASFIFESQKISGRSVKTILKLLWLNQTSLLFLGWSFYHSCRSSHTEMFCKRGVLESFAKSTGKQKCQSLFLIKFQALPVTLFKKRFWDRCFPVDFAKLLRTPFLQNPSGWLLLQLDAFHECYEGFSNRIILVFISLRKI